VASLMKVIAKSRALDKIYKRRDRYEIPDWQREHVWDDPKKQELIDSILRGWRLPKFYFLKTERDPESYEIVDGQQRLMSIYEFFDNVLPLSERSAEDYGGSYYKDLPSDVSDAFDDLEIDYDEITEATDEEIKLFFQRLQQGLPLTSSEKLNAVHSKLRNFCRVIANHTFFTSRVNFSNKRYAHFDVAAKAAAIQIEGLEASLRFDDLRILFEDQKHFSDRSSAAKRLNATLDYLSDAFPAKSSALRNRTIVQSVITLASRIVATGKASGTERRFRNFVDQFTSELGRQVELGLNATNQDFLRFQRSVSANVRGGTHTRETILLRRLLQFDAQFLEIFDPTVVQESGISEEVKRAADEITSLVSSVNIVYSAKTGKDLIKLTNKTTSSLVNLGRVIKKYPAYKEYIEGLYFTLWEGVGERMGEEIPTSFRDINSLRTDLQHDLDHGKKKSVVAKRKKIASVFEKYAGSPTPSTVTSEHFAVFQASLLQQIELDMRSILESLKSEAQPVVPAKPASNASMKSGRRRAPIES
jgi:hypothetical protein